MGWCPSTAGMEQGKLGSLGSCKAEVIGKSSKGPPLPLFFGTVGQGWPCWRDMVFCNCLCVMWLWVCVFEWLTRGFIMDRPIRCVVVMLTGNVMSSSFISNEGKNEKTNSQNILKEKNLIVDAIWTLSTLSAYHLHRSISKSFSVEASTLCRWVLLFNGHIFCIETRHIMPCPY